MRNAQIRIRKQTLGTAHTNPGQIFIYRTANLCLEAVFQLARTHAGKPRELAYCNRCIKVAVYVRLNQSNALSVAHGAPFQKTSISQIFALIRQSDAVSIYNPFAGVYADQNRLAIANQNISQTPRSVKRKKIRGLPLAVNAGTHNLSHSRRTEIDALGEIVPPRIAAPLIFLHHISPLPRRSGGSMGAWSPLRRRVNQSTFYNGEKNG
jgi:hypothetical protein